METIVDVTITPAEGARVTPRELLEDFADASPGWHFLEDASTHYAREKETAACILRYLDLETMRDLDLAFSGTTSSPGTLRLTIIDAQGAGQPLNLQRRNRVVERFLERFQAYLKLRDTHARLQVKSKTFDAAEQPALS